MAQETKAEDRGGAPVLADSEDMLIDESVAADMDSQPLNDLGVSVMDQDVLERNVAAQV